MGNQLSSLAPSQILSVDHYFTDLRDFEFDISLGSTRFFKVARAKHKEGLCVVKVFAVQDPSLPLQTYNKHITEITDKLQGVPYTLPFQKIIVTEKAGILVRQYVKDNLYDRISTRPFLNFVEKKWIVFQLLCALVQCHQNQIYHGDIKTENIMVTSWTSVLLTDFASFKPTYLQENNPADFSYFFDTSRRRTCYLAPERFLQDARAGELVNQQGDGILDLGLIKDHASELTSKMDIFSMGCVIAELFSEGNALFDLSRLLAYRSGDYDPSPALEKIDDKLVRELIADMICKDPLRRNEASEYLDRYRGSLFPEEFYTFLRVFMVRFASSPVLTPDERITRIADCTSVILKELGDNIVEEGEDRKKDTSSLVLIISLVTSSVRNCIYCDSKLQCLDVLLQLAQHLSDEMILERVIPYILYLVGDHMPRVRVMALHTLTQTLQLVQMLPKDEGNIFPEYILPALSGFPADEEVIVRIAYAENIAPIAETALKFLEMAQLSYMQEKVDLNLLPYQASYDDELQELHEVIQRKVVNLLSDSENIVKQTLLEKGITRLCVFFGRQKANDILLSHMITFLNDKQDSHLRAVFFDSIVGVASYVGWQSLAMLKPLLQQGLADTEEFVICKALDALTCLTELGLLQKSTLFDFTEEIVVFLCHPNMWIRYGAVGFVTAVTRALNLVDVHCKLLPLLAPFVRERILQAQEDVLLISVLKEPLSRSVFDFVLRSEQITAFFDSLQDRQLIRNKRMETDYPRISDENLARIFRKLNILGINDEQEEMLIRLKTVMLKIHRSKQISAEKNEGEEKTPGVVELKKFDIVRRHADLVVKNEVAFSQSKRKIKQQYTLNSEWNHIFGNMNETFPSSQPQENAVKQPLGRSVSAPSSSRPEPRTNSYNDDKQWHPVPARALKSNTESAKSSRSAPNYKNNLHELVRHKRELYTEEVRTRELIEEVITTNKKGQLRRPKGILVIHLHEHRSSVNKLAACPNSSLFASTSNDGTVKLWDAQRVEKQGMLVRSCFTFQFEQRSSRGKGLLFLQGQQSLACASNKGNIYIIDPEVLPNTSPTQCYQYKAAVSLSTSLDTTQAGDVIDMHQFDTASHSVITYATVRGYICGWDVRTPRTIWKLQNDPALGVITSFVVDPSQCWFCVGTCNGELVCWDLRFQLPVTRITHPRGARVRRLSASPLLQCKPSWVTCSVDGNNEVSVWNMETGACEKSLWASHAPPLSQTQVSPHSVYGVCTSPPENGQFILTAGSDRRIRLWDLQSPKNSGIVAGSSSDNLSDVVLKYTSRLIDGTEVFSEVYCKSNQVVTQDDVPKRGPDKPPTGHHDCITDLAFVTSPQHLLVSSGRDGVIKIWK